MEKNMSQQEYGADQIQILEGLEAVRKRNHDDAGRKNL